jgi:1,4-dihydroxy-2-naphthoate octaprenyltransferase
VHEAAGAAAALMRALARAWAIVRLGRPLFLAGGFALYLAGVLLASRLVGRIDVVIAVWGQLAISAIQLMTHYSNDYFDHATDAANTTPTRWSGGSRVLPQGEVSPRVALIAALCCGAIAIAAIGVLATMVTRGVIVVLAVLLVLAWSYSSPPLRLHTRGLGEPTVVAVVAIGTPLVGWYAQTSSIDVAVLALCLPFALLQLVMLWTIELPDEASDRATDKRSFVVVFGAARAVACARAAIVATYVALPLLAIAGVPIAVPLAIGATVPLGAFQLWRLQRWRDPQAWESLAFGSVALFFGSMVAALGGLMLA